MAFADNNNMQYKYNVYRSFKEALVWVEDLY
jgi:hypothetical protein